MNHRPMLVVHPDRSAAAMLSSMLTPLGMRIDEAEDERAAVRRLCHSPSLLLAGVDPLDSDALELLVYARRKHAGVPVVLLFTVPDQGRADEALRLGAFAVRPFPCPPVELRAVVTDALKVMESQEKGDGRAAGDGETSDLREEESRVRPSASERGRYETGTATKSRASAVSRVGRTAADGAALKGARASLTAPRLVPLRVAMEGTERQLLLEALRALDWNRREAAKILRINRTTLYKKIKKYGLFSVDGEGEI